MPYDAKLGIECSLREGEVAVHASVAIPKSKDIRNGSASARIKRVVLERNLARKVARRSTRTDTDTEYLFNVVYVKHDTA